MSSFQFRQFIIHQDDAPLKVTTDACLFGAIVKCKQATTVLDIGTGTGLLALMLAQRNSDAEITGIEIDNHTAELAKKNFEGSKFSNRLKLINADATKWSHESREHFNLIVCNPPFFSSSMKNSDKRKSVARHNDSLSHFQLSSIISKHLDPEGYAWIMLPPDEMKEFIKVIDERKLFADHKIYVSSSEKKKPHLVIASFSREQKSLQETKIFIHDSYENYSKEFSELLFPFYLHL